MWWNRILERGWSKHKLKVISQIQPKFWKRIQIKKSKSTVASPSKNKPLLNKSLVNLTSKSIKTKTSKTKKSLITFKNGLITLKFLTPCKTFNLIKILSWLGICMSFWRKVLVCGRISSSDQKKSNLKVNFLHPF